MQSQSKDVDIVSKSDLQNRFREMLSVNANVWRQFSLILDRLLESDAQSQSTEIATLRTRDPALADHIELLFQHYTSDPTFLMGAVLGSPELKQPLVGSQIGAYVIDGLISQGGNGSVWKAHHRDKGHELRVAIKLLHLTHIGRAGAQRFQREAKALELLNHPNIACLIESGETAARQPYLVLEFIDGEQIDAYCATHGLNVNERLMLFDEVLAAVTEAHKHRIIHCDIKPQNILVTASGEVKLLDFGIARLLDEDLGGYSGAIADQSMTPRYAAPEQLEGGTLTPATDIYALVVTLYELLVGRHPLCAPSTSVQDVARCTSEEEAVMQTSALGAWSESELERIAAERRTSSESFRTQLNGEIEQVFKRGMSKDPCHRYSSIQTLVIDLARFRQAIASPMIPVGPVCMAHAEAWG